MQDMRSQQDLSFRFQLWLNYLAAPCSAIFLVSVQKKTSPHRFLAAAITWGESLKAHSLPVASFGKAYFPVSLSF
jgi:hypothetical protein